MQHAKRPSLAHLHAAMLLSGFGTVFLGPSLPALAASAGVGDTGSGVFFTAQFAGAFLGGVTTHRRLLFCLLRGLLTASLGFALLALCAGLHAGVAYDAASLFLLGFGVGQMLTSSNLLAVEHVHEGRTAALSLLNFTWSFGAVTAPFFLGSALTVLPLSRILLGIALVLSATFAFTWWSGRGHIRGTDRPEEMAAQGLSRNAFLAFAFMLLLYGGVETSLSGWITTFGTRYGDTTLRISTFAATAFWIGITAGRALAAAVLRIVRERILLLASLSAAAGIVLVLTRSSGVASIIVLAALLGLSLAPWFPLVLSSMLGSGASPRETGLIIALSGIGAAVLPLLLGLVSHRTGSLRTALLVPLAGLLALLALAASAGSRKPLKSV